jgi:hypothetical protein
MSQSQRVQWPEVFGVALVYASMSSQVAGRKSARAACGDGLPSQVPVPIDALIDPRWSPAATQRHPRNPPHLPSEETMLPPLPRTGLGAARSRPEPGLRRNRHP